MNTNELNTALYEKMAAEQDAFRDWLKGQPPEEILNHAYEYTVREDIVMEMEALELSAHHAEALLASPSPLADVFRYFDKLETDHMDLIRDSIENLSEQKAERLMEQAKDLIARFCQAEYGSGPDFSNPAAVGIAYTTLTDDEIPIQVNVDLERHRIDRLLDGKPLEGWQYDSLASLVHDALQNLDFDDLTYVSDLEWSAVQRPEPEKAEIVPLYPHSADYAREHGELDQYRASNRANVQCKEAIEAAVREHFDGMYLSHDAASGVIQTYGLERVMHVLANTVQLHDWDNRYSRRNKEWANTVPNYNSDSARRGYILISHPAVLNGMIDLVREEYQRSRAVEEKPKQRASVREKLKQEPPARKPAVPKKREQER